MKTIYLSSIYFLFLSLIHAQDGGPSCSLNCTQEEFANAINPLICDAENDFESVTGEEAEPDGDYQIFEVKNLTFPGAKDMYLTYLDSDDNELLGKDLVLMFQCGDGKNKSEAYQYFEIISTAIESLKPECTTLDNIGTYDNLSDDFLKTSTWEGDIYTEDWEEYIDIELDIQVIDELYWIVLHINMPMW